MALPDLSIRAAEPRDIDALTALMNLPGVRHGTMRTPFTTRAFVERRIDGGPGVTVLVAEADGELVGQAVLSHHQAPRRSHAGEVYLFVHDEHVGRGYGSRMLETLLDVADNWLGLRRVELTVNVDNARAIRLYERLGFEHEGTRRADVLRDGELVDCHMMARLRPPPAYR